MYRGKAQVQRSSMLAQAGKRRSTSTLMCGKAPLCKAHGNSLGAEHLIPLVLDVVVVVVVVVVVIAAAAAAAIARIRPSRGSRDHRSSRHVEKQAFVPSLISLVLNMQRKA